MTEDNTKPDQTSTFVPEIAKLSKKTRMSTASTIAIILGVILFVGFIVYIAYFKEKTAKSSAVINKVESETEAIKKEFSFKKDKPKEAEEPLSQITQRTFNVKDKDKNSRKAAFEKYKSIPLKSDENIESPESSKKDTAIDEADMPVIAERIKIDPNFLILEGTYIPCSLTTKFVSDVTGRITCTIAEDVYSANGSVKLIEKGTKAVGSYQGGTLQHGKARMFIIWTKLITPDFKRIKLIDTQVVGQLGEAGIEGWVDSHFFERFGGALMLSVVKDIVKSASEGRQEKKGGNTVNINNMDNSKDSFVLIIEKLLENSINIAPTMYKNQGDIIGILVGRDIDFSKIYKLKMHKK
jgi:type IV secretion system protein VirB10